MSFDKGDRLSENSPLSSGKSVQTPARGSVEQSAEPHFLAVGRVTKPHGIRGEVRVELMTDDPERFYELEYLYVGEDDPRKVRIETVRLHQGVVLLKLAGYPTRTEAEQLRGALLQVPRAEAVPLDDDEYFLYQLEGLEVYTVDGDHIGRLVEVLETGANNVFVVNGPGGQHLLPDIPDVIKEIDLENGRLVILPISGLIPGLGE